MISYQPEFDPAEELYTPEEVAESIWRGVAQAEAGEVEEMPWITIDESIEGVRSTGKTSAEALRQAYERGMENS